MSCYDYLDYKLLLRETLKSKREAIGPRFTYEKMAAACGIQKTYLSRVVNSEDAHLSEDQLYHACVFLGFAKDERKYIAMLRDHQKSTALKRKEELLHDIESIRRKHQRSEAFLTASSLDGEADLASYFLDPVAIIVHVALAIERYRKDLGALQRDLNISKDKIDDVIVKLEKLRLIAVEDGRFKLIKDSIHLPQSSPIYPAFRTLQRVKSLERIQALDEGRSYNFSVVFSASDKARNEIKSLFLKLLQDIEAIVGKSKDEEVYQMNFDLFDWTIGRP
jgi:uncharacterized protein (TIGR02147 family)